MMLKTILVSCERFFPVFAPVFEVLHTAQAAEPAVDHDGHPSAKGFTLLHAVRKNNHVRTYLSWGDNTEIKTSKSVCSKKQCSYINIDSM